jgi:uncharacterized damage-inducible protein DinB
MDYQNEEAVEILRRTPATLKALLSGLPEAWTSSTEGPGTWSASDIVGHLLHGEESDWIERTRIILEYGEERPFDSFNRTAMFEDYKGFSLEQLLLAFEVARSKNLETLRDFNITPEKLTLKGSHPSLGTVTLSQLLATWVAHDLNHMGQIVEVMSRQYADAVGPWITYLGILNRPIITEE